MYEAPLLNWGDPQASPYACQHIFTSICEPSLSASMETFEETWPGTQGAILSQPLCVMLVLCALKEPGILSRFYETTATCASRNQGDRDNVELLVALLGPVLVTFP